MLSSYLKLSAATVIFLSGINVFSMEPDSEAEDTSMYEKEKEDDGN